MAPCKSSLALLAVASFAAHAAAHPEFRQKIPNALNVKGVDAIGHVDKSGGGARNKFGLAFAANGLQWTKALCQADSDGDGQTNGQELGDPCCEWVQTSNAKVLWTAGVSAPGDATSKSDPTLWATVKCNGTASSNSTVPAGSANATTATTMPVATTTTTTTTLAPATATSTPAATAKSPNTTVPSATKSGAAGVSAGVTALALGVATTVAVLFM